MKTKQPLVAAVRPRRRGAVAVFLMISLVFLLGMAALAVDAGMMYSARAELQRTADASALAGTMALLDDRRIVGDQTAFANARYDAAAYGGLNDIMTESILIEANSANAGSGDIVIGFLADPDDGHQSLTFLEPNTFNSVQVRARKDEERNGSLSLSFARIFDFETRDGFAQATATYRGDVRGFKITPRSGNAQLLPIALHVSVWNRLLAGTQTTGDAYSSDPDSGAVSNGGDGAIEFNLYPGAGTGQLPPGNFGTVDIGSENNSTADIARQIRYGVSEEDLV
ncbi:MAG: pilus assembly protein TadG-related protein [Phycisphaerae bacterium]